MSIETSPKITFSYPLIFATKLQPSYTGYIHYSFPGKENEPNITVQTQPSDISTRYVSKDLYIFSKIHDFSQDTDGELVIAHDPLINSNKPFYMCFPLKSDPTSSQNTSIAAIISDDDSSQATTKEIDLMSSLEKSKSATAYYYETPYASIAVAQNPIQVPNNFVGFNRGKLQDLWEPPRDVVAAQLSTSGGCSSCKLHAWIAPKPVREGMDGMCDGSYCYFDCDYADAGFENEVPTYMIKAGSDQITLKEKSLNYAMNSMWFVVILLIIVWVGPFLFSILGSRAVYNMTEHTKQLYKLDSIEGGLGQLLLIPSIILISVGVPKNLYCAPDDDECVKTANDLIVPGVILLATWVCYAGALFIYKIFMPDFIGYKDPATKTNPIFTYARNEIHIRQHFMPDSLFNMIWSLLFPPKS